MEDMSWWLRHFVDEQYVASSIYVCRGQVLMGVEGKELDVPGFRQT